MAAAQQRGTPRQTLQQGWAKAAERFLVARWDRSSRIWLTARSRPGRLAFINQSSRLSTRATRSAPARTGVDAGPADRDVGPGIGVQRDEQVGVGAAGDLHALLPAE
jgi:hypothetical protein